MRLSSEKRSNKKGSEDRDTKEGEDTDTEKKVETDYDPSNEEVTVYVNKPGGVDSISVLIDGEVEHVFSSPSEGEKVTLSMSEDESLSVKSKSSGYFN